MAVPRTTNSILTDYEIALSNARVKAAQELLDHWRTLTPQAITFTRKNGMLELMLDGEVWWTRNDVPQTLRENLQEFEVNTDIFTHLVPR